MALGNLSNLQSLSRRSKGAKEVLMLDTAEVEPKQGQVREKFAGIEELAESIARRGLIQSLHVRPVLDGEGQVCRRGYLTCMQRCQG